MDLTDDNSCPNVSEHHYESGQYCPPYHDEIICWPATLANTTAHQHCSVYFSGKFSSTAHRRCLANGQWEPLSNYSACLEGMYILGDHHNHSSELWVHHEHRTAQNLMMIMFCGSVASLVVLLFSLLVFSSLKALQCQRTSIHKNLIASFVLRFLIMLVLLEPHVFDHAMWYKSLEWVCRALITLQQLSYVANFYWMLVEGLYLHLILVMRPFDNEKVPFLFFYFIGWVIPLMIAVTWALVMHFEHEVSCWSNNSQLPFIFIIYVPIIFALLVNLLILMNLVRLIISKLCSGHVAEQRRICRTIKSTLVLVFLLGIINLVFFTSANASAGTTLAYRYINAILPFSQGIIVSVLYCGMNSEVRRAMRKRWHRFLDSRSSHSSRYRGRSSRTSLSMFVSRPQQGNDAEPHIMELHPLKDPLKDPHSTGT